jgi:hypothetical protein
VRKNPGCRHGKKARILKVSGSFKLKCSAITLIALVFAFSVFSLNFLPFVGLVTALQELKHVADRPLAEGGDLVAVADWSACQKENTVAPTADSANQSPAYAAAIN